jgi:general secretion pathway protein M
VAANPGERAGQPALDDGQAPRLQQLSQQPAPAARALTALVMREAASHGLTVVRLQPQENVCRSPFSPALSRR